MTAYRKQDICIGIYGGKNTNGDYYIANQIIDIFHKYGFKNVTIDDLLVQDINTAFLIM